MATITETPPKTTQLPIPQDLPDADVLIFDGQCKFCRGAVERIYRWDGQGRVAYISLHDPFVAEQYPDLTHDQMMEQMYLVDRNGHRHAGAAAFRYLTRRLPKLWILAPIMHIPFMLPVWQRGYKQVAKQRYRWGKVDDCDNGTCSIHFD